MKTKAQRIAASLTEEQIIYLYIANDLWDGTDVFCDSVIEDVKETGGEFTSDNWVALDYCEQEFDNEHVANVINTWKSLHDDDGELRSEYNSLDVLDELMGEMSMLDNFYCVTFNVAGETGSSEWPARSDDEVEILEILQHVNAHEIAQEFLEA